MSMFPDEEERVLRVGDLKGDASLGDIMNNMEERHQKYWNIYRPAHPVPDMPPVSTPLSTHPSAIQQMCDCIQKMLRCQTLRMQPPLWLEPTATSIRIDKKTFPCVPLPPGSYLAPAPFVDVLCLKIPDLTVGVLWGIGMLLEDDQDFDVVEWKEERNGAVLIDGQYFFQKADPTKMHRDMEPVPIILPPLSTFCLRARNTLLGGAPKCATARITGHMVAIRDITAGGGFGEFCVT